MVYYMEKLNSTDLCLFHVVVILVGNLIPLSQVREDVIAAYRKDMEWETNELLLPYKKMFALKKVWLYWLLKFDIKKIQGTRM